MPYTFVRCRADDRFPAEGWYLKITWADQDAIDRMHKAVASSLFMKYVVDPHLFDDNHKPKNTIADLVDPLKLGGGWLSTLYRICDEFGHALVNPAGGIRPPSKQENVVKVLDKLSWPVILDDEWITLMQWPNAQHYYLKSNKNRLFSPEKYETFDEAWKVAMELVPENRIRVSTARVELKKPDGD